MVAFVIPKAVGEAEVCFLKAGSFVIAGPP